MEVFIKLFSQKNESLFGGGSLLFEQALLRSIMTDDR
jgi:hypothetical protein